MISAQSHNAISSRGQDKDNADKGAPSATSGPVTSAILETITQTAVPLPTEEEMQAVVDASKPRPKANPDAKTPVDVYPIKVVLPAEQEHLLKVSDWLDARAAQGEILTTSRYVSHRVGAIASHDESARLKLLKFMHCLIQFYRSLKTATSGKMIIPKKDAATETQGADATIMRSIRQRFAPRQ